MSLRVIQTVGARIADQVDQMSPESNDDFSQLRFSDIKMWPSDFIDCPIDTVIEMQVVSAVLEEQT
ncbi:unnamed protein product [Prunus armeniaca]